MIAYLKIKAKGSDFITRAELIPGNFNDLELHERQKAVGGYIELVWFPENQVIGDFKACEMIIHEEGRLQNEIHVNHFASNVAGQEIVGDVVILLYSADSEAHTLA